MTTDNWLIGYNAALQYFLNREAGRTLKRRPVWALRLNQDNGGLVVIKPALSHSRVARDRLIFEILAPLTVNGLPGMALEVRGVMTPEGIRATRYNTTRFEGDERTFEKIKAALDGFVADPVGMAARASNHCMICGKGFTDEVSKARGIGPECIKGFNGLLRLIKERIKPVALVDRLDGETLSFQGETLAQVDGIGTLNRNHDNGGLVVDYEYYHMNFDQDGCDSLLTMCHPDHACPEVGGPTAEEEMQGLCKNYLLVSEAARNGSRAARDAIRNNPEPCELAEQCIMDLIKKSQEVTA